MMVWDVSCDTKTKYYVRCRDHHVRFQNDAVIGVIGVRGVIKVIEEKQKKVMMKRIGERQLQNGGSDN